LTGGTQHKFTPKDYLLKLAQARFGLCLRGYGVKCHREVELMAFGTVPIVTPHVDMTSYLEPLKEGIHYVRVKGPEEVPETLAKISAEQWQIMSTACKDWYMRNIHSDSMWRTFMGHLLYDTA
jgi:glycosyltransferase involved in cell wall biosynthesis